MAFGLQATLRTALCLVTGALLFCLPLPAGAEPEPAAEEALAGARRDFQKALALQTAGDWAGALALLKKVAEVRSTPQVRFNIALCEEHLGQLVAALGDYELAASDARAAGIALVETEALERIERLRQRIPQLRVERGEGAARASVTLDGVELGERALGRDMPVDPGTHEVRASVPGRPEFVEEVRLAEGQRAAVTIRIPAPVDTPTTPTKPEPEPGASGQRVMGYVTGSIGVAGLAAAGVFYALRYDALQDLDALCPTRKSCPPEGREIEQRGRQHTMYGNVALGVGIAGLVTTAVLWLTDRPTQETAAPGSPDPAGRLVLGHEAAPLGATWVSSF